ncbi:Rrf2 family transcriptional regulator [Pseudalgibacter alginicilyticus]|uniref:Rrf2 family transcriptional regulator n=1 Tax=Pseudalgibacter alginicilyticus TaxID=1736674 RepID=A0A0P0CR30_9FLAO|nr:Rrf2 family transcriptional regulator [Pseudalgibacter alginicilyticus]ALJ05277.1 Rrf2 family transcriptional regulator [Pseudalgibacter alginicilyticus]
MLSNSSKYAIKAVLFLALKSNKENKVMAKDVAAPINVPQAYIAKLLQELVKVNMVSSKKGPNGGFYLSEENLKKSVLDIIYVIDGKNKLSACMISLDACDEDKPCPLHDILVPSRNLILKTLKGKTIYDLMLSVKSGDTFLPL